MRSVPWTAARAQTELLPRVQSVPSTLSAGLDNSGETKYVEWNSDVKYDPTGMYAPKGTFKHWENKGWDWIINSTADWGKAMSLINWKHWDHSIMVITKVVAMYGKHPAVWGLSPVNEVGPWTPMDVSVTAC